MSLEELWELFPIIIKDHNPAYKEWYLREERQLTKAIGQRRIRRISHIGSTAVEGLPAKPIIDILLEIDHNCDIERLQSTLQKAGWRLMSSASEPDFEISFNKGYTPSGFAERVFHLHVRYLGDWNELYFRDFLVEHKKVALEYAKLKLALKEQFEHDRDGYTNAKSDFILKYSKIAKEEYPNRYALR